jgi:hypothetical protein
MNEFTTPTGRVGRKKSFQKNVHSEKRSEKWNCFVAFPLWKFHRVTIWSVCLFATGLKKGERRG